MLQNTHEVVDVDGVRCRIWKGRTAGGVPVSAFIHLLATDYLEDNRQFEAELEEQPPPKNAGVIEPILDQLWDRR